MNVAEMARLTEILDQQQNQHRAMETILCLVENEVVDV